MCRVPPLSPKGGEGGGGGGGGRGCWGATKATSPSVVVVTPLKPKRIHLLEFSIPKESFICSNADICNKSVVMLGSISTLCTSKPLI